jgi:hypothetical protein
VKEGELALPLGARSSRALLRHRVAGVSLRIRGIRWLADECDGFVLSLPGLVDSLGSALQFGVASAQAARMRKGLIAH